MSSLCQIAFSLNALGIRGDVLLSSRVVSEFLRAYQRGDGQFVLLSLDYKVVKPAHLIQIENYLNAVGVNELTPILALPRNLHLSSALVAGFLRLKLQFSGLRLSLNRDSLRSTSNASALSRLRRAGIELSLFTSGALPPSSQIGALGVSMVVASTPKQWTRLQRETRRLKQAHLEVAWIWNGEFEALAKLSQIDGVSIWVLGEVLVTQAVIEGASAATRRILAELRAP